jgi:protein-tyrosine phosphatase
LPSLVDMHVHLLAGLDDGPKTMEDALAMARLLVNEGARHSVALAHQNDEYPLVTPERIRVAATDFANALRAADVPLEVYPAAEVMAWPELVADWSGGKLMSIADRGQWLLIEFPHNLFIDLRPIARDLRAVGVRAIVAHAERIPQMLHVPGLVEELIQLGCLVQVSSSSVTQPAAAKDEKALKEWFKRGIVHLLGSDGHSPRRRAPQLAAAAEVIRHWVGAALAEQICGGNGLSILRGAVPAVAPPLPSSRSWFARLFS